MTIELFLALLVTVLVCLAFLALGLNSRDKRMDCLQWHLNKLSDENEQLKTNIANLEEIVRHKLSKR